MNEYRNFTCGQLRAADAGKRVRLAGWVHRKRNLGNLCFVDLRDHYGITQCVFDSASPLFEKMQGIRVESVIGIDGEAVIRENINKNIPTGEIEIKVDGLKVYSEAEVRRSRWRSKTTRRKKSSEIPFPRFAQGAHSQKHSAAFGGD